MFARRLPKERLKIYLIDESLLLDELFIEGADREDPEEYCASDKGE